MIEIENASIVDGEVVGDNLILTKFDTTTIDAGNVRGPAGTTASATYTPTLTGMAIGTGGGALNTAFYAFAGGPNVDDIGIMSIQGEIKFGTTGATLPSAASTLVALPSGFNFQSMLTLGNAKIGLWDWLNASWTLTGLLTPNSLSTIKLSVMNANGNVTSRVTGDNVSATSPGTWVVGNSILWHTTFIAKRV